MHVTENASKTTAPSSPRVPFFASMVRRRPKSGEARKEGGWEKIAARGRFTRYALMLSSLVIPKISIRLRRVARVIPSNLAARTWLPAVARMA